MILGIVVHASMPYWSELASISFFWPPDERQSTPLWLIFTFIHTWRMPLFFLLSGFFASLLLNHYSLGKFILNRIHRILIPLVIFGFITALVLPPIWSFGNEGSFTFMGIKGFPSTATGHYEFLGHLWFLYYLLIYYPLIILASVVIHKIRLRIPNYIRPIGITTLYAVLPIGLIICVASVNILILFFGQGSSKTVWPLNVPDLIYHGIFFMFGFGLYYKPQLLATLQTAWVFTLFLMLATFSSLVQIASIMGIGDAKSPEEAKLLGLVIVVSTSCASVLFCLGLIGFFQRILQRYVKRIRWLSDSSYWIYIMHLPVVAITTFYLFRYDLHPEIKFLISCLVTLAIGLITYRYLIRYSPIGWLLNGR